MCSLGTCFLIGHKFWDQYVVKTTLVHDELVLHASEVARNSHEVNTQEEFLTCFDGSVADAFDILNGKMKSSGHDFTPLAPLLENSVMLRDDSKLFRKGVLIESVFSVLFGSKSCCCKRFHELRGDKDLRFQPPHPLISEGAPWGAYDTLTCKVPVQVLGLCKYDEVRRFALCREKDSVTLAMQQAGTIRAGFYGEFTAELLYLFKQADCDDTVHMQVFALAPKGCFATQTLEGYRKTVKDFCTVAAEAQERERIQIAMKQEQVHTAVEQKQRQVSDPSLLISCKTSEEIFFSLLDSQIY
mmetsp:Transcript_7172/g.11665  ORF Transcript_7172/g.11665 Transcript_7172/m.11665 type:complete len:300 (-) Transcript_7172:321-1220(-)